MGGLSSVCCPRMRETISGEIGNGRNYADYNCLHSKGKDCFFIPTTHKGSQEHSQRHHPPLTHWPGSCNLNQGLVRIQSGRCANGGTNNTETGSNAARPEAGVWVPVWQIAHCLARVSGVIDRRGGKGTTQHVWSLVCHASLDATTIWLCPHLPRWRFFFENGRMVRQLKNGEWSWQD